MAKLGLEFNLEDDKFQLGICKFDKSMRDKLYKNPHCIEYFCIFDNCKNCSQCYKYLKQKYNNYYDKLEKEIEFTEEDKNLLLHLASNEEECNDCIKDGIMYGVRRLTRYQPEYATHNVDKIKGIANKDNFERKELIEKVYDALPVINKLDPDNVISYESTTGKTTTVIKWGQLKLFLEVLFSFLKVLDKKDFESNKNVHVIYAGSAPGTSLIMLCKLLPFLQLYLIDPRKQAPGLFNNKNVIEIKNEYFTDDTAKYYFDKMVEPKERGEKVIFMSDIRIATDDESINRDNTIQAGWHRIIKPDWSFLKFRCPYEAPNNKIQYFDAEYYFQPFAPIASTETRVLVPTECEFKDIDVLEYQRICYFHNRVLRPSYYLDGLNHLYFDRCFDCTFFMKIMQDYNKLSPNHFKGKDIMKIMQITVTTFENTQNKLEMFTNSIKANLIK